MIDQETLAVMTVGVVIGAILARYLLAHTLE